MDVAAQLVSAFRLHHPRVTVRLLEPRRPPYLARELREGEAHLGVSYPPLREDEGLAVERLREIEMAAVFPPGAEPGPDPLPLARLAGVPLIGGVPGSGWRELLDRTLAAAGVQATVVVESGFRDAVAGVVLSGGAAAVLPYPHAQEIAGSGGVLRRLEPGLARDVAVVHRRGPLPPAAAAFLATAREWAAAGEQGAPVDGSGTATLGNRP